MCLLFYFSFHFLKFYFNVARGPTIIAATMPMPMPMHPPATYNMQQPPPPPYYGPPPSYDTVVNQHPNQQNLHPNQQNQNRAPTQQNWIKHLKIKWHVMKRLKKTCSVHVFFAPSAFNTVFYLLLYMFILFAKWNKSL